MRKHLAKTLLAGGLLLSMFASTAQATMLIKMDLDDLARLAPVVVMGEVNQVQSRFNTKQTRITTSTWITPSEVLKGPADLGMVEIQTIGGQVGQTVARIPGAPVFTPGEKVVVFLEPRRKGRGFHVIGFFQGKFKVFKDPKSNKQLLLQDKPGKGVHFVNDDQPAMAGKLPSLDGLRKLIRGGGK